MQLAKFWHLISAFIGCFLWSHTILANPLVVERVEMGTLSTSGVGFVEALGFKTASLSEASKVDHEENLSGEFLVKYPNAAFDMPVPLECHPKTLESELRRKLPSEVVANKIRQKYFSKCGRWLNRKGYKGLFTLLEFSRVEYDIFENPQVHALRVYFENGDVSYGIVGLKPGAERRPLVIVKCGLFCDGSPSTSIKTIMMHLFDESPFNVIILGNNTGTNSVRDNHRIVFGGFFEGHEIMAVGKWAREKAPFRNSISSVHSMGISLGGNASLFAALYNDHNRLEHGKKVFDSAVAYCPAVNIKPTIESLYGWKYFGYLASLVTWRNVQSVLPQVPELADFFSGEPPEPQRFPDLLGEAATRYLATVNEDDYLRPFKDKPLTDLYDFWQLNDFTRFAKQVGTPTLVWGAKDDMVVKNKFNAGDLAERLDGWNGNLQVLNLDAGSHCAFSVAYGWPTAAAVLRSFILNHDSDVGVNASTEVAALSLPSRSFDKDDVHVNQVWEAHPGRSEFTVKFMVWSQWHESVGPHDDCRMSRPFTATANCYETVKIKVPFSGLPFSIAAPKSKTDAQILTRWANTQFEILGDTGPLTGTGDTPRFVRWYR
ncbi:MAG: hypothetical protein H6626_06480 [Pseudobdellovibrionaceae bacterium]|nr:hypothetical protein [Bdellovibrionales bacterium]USN48732.1 MAG: hypothetical protein H6626_06480 [Pseudobdellovibrionaceae bacterium]